MLKFLFSSFRKPSLGKAWLSLCIRRQWGDCVSVFWRIQWRRRVSVHVNIFTSIFSCSKLKQSNHSGQWQRTQLIQSADQFSKYIADENLRAWVTIGLVLFLIGWKNGESFSSQLCTEAIQNSSDKRFITFLNFYIGLANFRFKHLQSSRPWKVEAWCTTLKSAVLIIT